MAATFTTKELINDVSEANIQGEIELRLKAGAIKAWVAEEDGENYLFTKWNVIGEQ